MCPAAAVTLARLCFLGQTAMRYLDLRAIAAGRQFPADDRLALRIRVPFCNPGIDQKARRIDLQNLAVSLKVGGAFDRCPIAPLGSVMPLPAGPRVHLPKIG